MLLQKSPGLHEIYLTPEVDPPGGSPPRIALGDLRSPRGITLGDPLDETLSDPTG